LSALQPKLNFQKTDLDAYRAMAKSAASISLHDLLHESNINELLFTKLDDVVIIFFKCFDNQREKRFVSVPLFWSIKDVSDRPCKIHFFPLSS
jgi:hypothetical protein